MGSELQDQLKAAIQLAQQGQRDAARGLLLRVVEADPRQEVAWMWLAVVSTNQEERLQYLERTLALNPRNERALSAYTKLTGRVFQPSAPAPTPSAPAPTPPAAPRITEDTSAALRPASGQPVDWTDSLKTRRSPLMTLLVVAVTVAIMLGGAYIFIGAMFSENQKDSTPTFTALPTGMDALDLMLSGTPGLIPVTSTPDVTPLPTVTPGPSPTGLFANPEATWTPKPSPTQPPTRTPLPSYTPLPTATATPAESPTPRPTRTPRPSATPGEGEAKAEESAEPSLTTTPD